MTTRTPAGLRRGFTLVELLVAVLIAAILMAIAIPSYRSYVQRAQRSEATAALTRARAAQERFFVQYNRYTAELEPAPPTGVGIPAVTDNGLYSLAVELTADGFRLMATPRAEGGQRDDAKCATLGIDQSGRRSGLGADGTDTTRDCWR
jgi:type IV pilus assembly protein PilE